MITFLALAIMVAATQLVGWGWGDNVSCTCNHGGCYATGGLGWGVITGGQLVKCRGLDARNQSEPQKRRFLGFISETLFRNISV